MNKIQLVATGADIIFEGVRGFESLLEELISVAKSDIHVLTYNMTYASGSVFKLLTEALKRGVKVILIINSYDLVDTKSKKLLDSLNVKYHNNFCLGYFKDKTGENIHAKVIVVDRKKAIVGSANLSWGGIVDNYEVGVFIEGDIAWSLAKIIDKLYRKMEGS